MYDPLKALIALQRSPYFSPSPVLISNVQLAIFRGSIEMVLFPGMRICRLHKDDLRHALGGQVVAIVAVLVLFPMITLSRTERVASKNSPCLPTVDDWVLSAHFKQWLSPLSPSQIDHYGHLLDIQRVFDSKFEATDFCATAGLVCDDQDVHYKKLIDPVVSLNETVFFERDLPHLQVQADFLHKQTVGDKNRLKYLPSHLEKLIADDLVEKLHIDKKSELGKIINDTNRFCRVQTLQSVALRGESGRRKCIWSVEELAAFAESSLNTSRLEIVQNDVFSGHGVPHGRQIFKVVETVLKNDVNSTNVNCHSLTYPFRVLMCHSLQKTRVYQVKLESVQSPKSFITQAAICHLDTSGFHPKHIILKFLNMKPGDGGFCHWGLSGTFAIVKRSN